MIFFFWFFVLFCYVVRLRVSMLINIVCIHIITMISSVVVLHFRFANYSYCKNANLWKSYQ